MYSEDELKSMGPVKLKQKLDLHKKLWNSSISLQIAFVLSSVYLIRDEAKRIITFKEDSLYGKVLMIEWSAVIILLIALLLVLLVHITIKSPAAKHIMQIADEFDSPLRKKTLQNKKLELEIKLLEKELKKK